MALKIKRGNSVPSSLEEGELAYSKDKDALYIGNGTKVVKLVGDERFYKVFTDTINFSDGTNLVCSNTNKMQEVTLNITDSSIALNKGKSGYIFSVAKIKVSSTVITNLGAGVTELTGNYFNYLISPVDSKLYFFNVSTLA